MKNSIGERIVMAMIHSRMDIAMTSSRFFLRTSQGCDATLTDENAWLEKLLPSHDAFVPMADSNGCRLEPTPLDTREYECEEMMVFDKFAVEKCAALREVKPAVGRTPFAWAELTPVNVALNISLVEPTLSVLDAPRTDKS